MSASQDRTAAGERAGHGLGHHVECHPGTPATNYAELLRSVPGVNISQTSARDFNITMRGAIVDAGHLAAGADRRPQPLPRFLRLRRVGFPADEPQRDPADRGDPRAGVGGVGRQRAERGRQLHLEDARASWPATAPRIGVGTFDRDVTGRHGAETGALCTVNAHARARGQRSLGRTRCRRGSTRPDAYCAADRHHRRRRRHAVSVVRQHGHEPAEVRRAASTTTAPTATTSCRSPAATPAPRASSTPASGRSTWTPVPALGYGTVRYTRNALRVNFFTNILNGDATGAARRSGRPGSRSCSCSTPRPTTSRSGNVNTIGNRHVLSYGGNFRYNRRSTCRSRRAATTAPSSAPTCQDEIFLNDQFRVDPRRARRQVRRASTTPMFSPRIAVIFKPRAGSRDPPVVQQGVPLAVAHQQLPRRRRSSTR